MTKSIREQAIELVASIRAKQIGREEANILNYALRTAVMDSRIQLDHNIFKARYGDRMASVPEYEAKK